ncbi:protein FAM83D [Stegastes partitus]|uniref:Family with sequence similarity 83 member D n=1 Tax=Stegastes partitus TaxID=144197 RepID=A0A3B5B3I5_9TELE|nr:PREDICTED: protein FAM83D [Stegastes partitus]
MSLSQCLEDSPLRLCPTPGAGELNLQEVYNERHRLALEELLSGGLDNFLDFLRRERISNFLSDDEIQRIRSAAVSPRCASIHGEDQTLEQSLSSSVDCSSVTYFPEVSDVEPPLLEMGWPAFTAGSYRGVTRAVAHFQPSYGECIYSCKEAARRMIKNAREVIAIVTDSLTDLDIFKDLQEACSHRRVPVYILLDQSCAPAFLKMCRNANVRLDDLQQMRVRTITGTTYYMRSGARITGEVHERFMLIDGNRVATGSYRFNWTDGKLNSSNLVELSGQITEKFDEEFRILYAQSLPLNTRGPPSVRNSGIYEHLLIKHSSSSHLARERPVEPVCLTSTPNRKPQTLTVQPPPEPSSPDHHITSPLSDSSTVRGDWMEQQEEILAGSTTRHFPAEQQAEEQAVTSGAISCHASTQTSRSVADSDTQTDLQLTQRLGPIAPTSSGPNQDTSPSFASSGQISPTQAVPDTTLKDCFHKLTKERQYHYSTIRSKLEHMVTALSERRELADVTNMTQGLGARSRQRIHKDSEQEPNPRLPVESAGMGTWPRARCVH